ncbi:MAG: aminotransferase class IV, partial [Anaerolineales bacterium]|nr:aminotransferase class IV [Anaerolineales bacterium]
GKIYEGMTSNFYVIASRRRSNLILHKKIASGKEQARPRNDMILITAQRGILLGVTRKAVLKLAREQGLHIKYRAPLLNDSFDEAFLTSSSRGVVPIISIDDKSVGQGGVGAWTKRLSQAYQVYIQARSEFLNPKK